MTGGGNQAEDAPAQRDRFIPVRKADILGALIDHGRLPADEADKFRLFARLLGAIYHYEYLDRLEGLRNDYYYFNPDLPHNAPVDPQTLARAHDGLVATLTAALAKADFVEVTREEIARSHEEHPVLNVKVALPEDDYREVRFFRRGERRETVEVSKWFGLRNRKVEVDLYGHLVLMVMIKPASEITSPRLARRLARNRLRPGTILLKYFRDVARCDVNTLFPNVRVVMGLFDKLFLGLPAIVGGIPILLKLIPAIAVLALVITAWLGTSRGVRGDDAKEALAAMGALIAVGGFVMRQWFKYKHQSLLYQKQISDNVYFRNISNNAGVLDYIVGTAEEQECKEAFLAYYFLRAAGPPSTQAELDRHIEEWLEATFRVEVDFEVAEALAKLERLKLLRRDGEKLTVPALDDALAILDRTWVDFFPLRAAPAPSSS
ncbi:MAG TPA: TMEM143 family protein [Xanthobacteraceae bacterium]|nr:TMEM143 family protein [Xanthobacteraceae bacterium]